MSIRTATGRETAKKSSSRENPPSDGERDRDKEKIWPTDANFVLFIFAPLRTFFWRGFLPVI